MKLRFSALVVLSFLALNLGMIKQSRADWVFLPDSNHQLFESFGNYFDQQTVLTYYGNNQYGEGRIWAAVGGELAIYGDETGPLHTQIVANATANAALHFSSTFKLFTDTVDARLGVTVEFQLDPTLRLSVGIQHASGHAADGLNNNDFNQLYSPTLGEEYVPIRLVKDFGRYLRVGGEFKPYILSTPSLGFFSFDLFAEYFPWGALDDMQKPSPYIALGLDELQISNTDLSWNCQIGFYLGNHFSPGFKHTLRGVVGYYTGGDPRLKYFQFQEAFQAFGYAGLMADI